MKRVTVLLVAFLMLSGIVLGQHDAPTTNEASSKEVVSIQNAKFPGDKAGFDSYFSKNFTYPTISKEDNVSGKMEVRLLIQADGTAKFVQAKGVQSKYISKEINKVVEEMPKWYPALKNGEPIAQVIKFNMNLNLD